MEIQQILLLCLVGLLAGVIAGTLGVGGGIIMVPTLIFLFSFTQHQAQGTSLAVLLLPMSILAVIQYHKSGYINYKFVLILALTYFVGSYLGGLFAVNLPAKTLTRIFGVFMLLVGLKMILGK
jgi:uncharacterized protein